MLHKSLAVVLEGQGPHLVSNQSLVGEVRFTQWEGQEPILSLPTPVPPILGHLHAPVQPWSPIGWGQGRLPFPVHAHPAASH